MYYVFISSFIVFLLVFIIVYRFNAPKRFIPYYQYKPMTQYFHKNKIIKGPIIPIKTPPISIPTYRMRQFIIYPSPNSSEKKKISNCFNFKTWDGTLWTAYLIDDNFYVKQMGSYRTFKTRVLNILRFRSQQWQMAYLPYKNMFMVFRFNGINGIPYKKIDLIDWDDYSQDIELSKEIDVPIN